MPNEKNGFTKALRIVGIALSMFLIISGFIWNVAVTWTRVEAQEKAYAMVYEDLEKNKDMVIIHDKKIAVIESTLATIEINQKTMIQAATMFQKEYKQDMRYLAELIKNER